MSEPKANSGFTDDDLAIRTRLLKRRKITSDGCWEFTGGRDKRGYGRMWNGEKSERVPRIAYKVFVGQIKNQHICHRCDNPPCFNPEHLFSGSSLDNMQDKIAKGRARYVNPLGESHGMHKLTLDEVKKIIADRKAGITLPAIVSKYGVSMGCIQKIVYGVNWIKALSKGARE